MTVVQDAGDNLLAGLPIIRLETHGRHSLSEHAALKFRAQLRRRARENAAFTASVARTGRLPPDSEVLDKHLGLSPVKVLAWHYDPTLWRCPVQTSPESVRRTYFLLGGRGAGKTCAGSVAVIEEAMADPEARLLIVGPTDSEVRKTQLEGPSGILSLAPPWFPHAPPAGPGALPRLAGS